MREDRVKANVFLDGLVQTLNGAATTILNCPDAEKKESQEILVSELTDVIIACQHAIELVKSVSLIANQPREEVSTQRRGCGGCGKSCSKQPMPVPFYPTCQCGPGEECDNCVQPSVDPE